MFLSELWQDTKIHLFHRTLSFIYNEQSKPNTDDLDYPSLQQMLQSNLVVENKLFSISLVSYVVCNNHMHHQTEKVDTKDHEQDLDTTNTTTQ